MYKYTKKFQKNLTFFAKNFVFLCLYIQEHGLTLVKVSPSYTSQMCSKCGSTNKQSRNGETYKCISCGYVIDADYNAAINIHSKGAYSLFGSKSGSFV